MDGRCFTSATPCTLNLLQARCMGEKKHHLQNLQQFQRKFEVEKQGPWSEVETKKSHIGFDCKYLGPMKSKVMVPKKQ